MITYEKMRDRRAQAEINLNEQGTSQEERTSLRLEIAYCDGAMDALCDNGLCPKE